MDKQLMEQEAIKDFNKAITCLAIELPEAVWSDVHLRWLKVHNEIGVLQSTVKELEREVERLKGLVKSQFFKYYDDDFQQDIWETFKTENNL